MNTYGIIMAGGGGTRFWPLSRKNRPKQFLNLTGKDSLINETIDRLSDIIPNQDVFVVTAADYGTLTLEETNGRISENHILKEPAARNTAACIGYAAMELIKKYGDGIMCIFPSDHHIRDEKAFQSVLSDAISEAENSDCLVTIGITPTFPSTGYGYIKRLSADSRDVQEFVEKPCLEKAEEYLESGEYLWNSGMFVWKASLILSYMEKLLPDLFEALSRIGDAMGSENEEAVISELYPSLPKISIDYGILERAEHVRVIPGDFGWNDVGSLDAFSVLSPADENGNILNGSTVLNGVENCIIRSDGSLIAACGIKDLIIVEDRGVFLVCSKKHAQDVKNIVETLQNKNQTEFI